LQKNKKFLFFCTGVDFSSTKAERHQEAPVINRVELRCESSYEKAQNAQIEQDYTDTD